VAISLPEELLRLVDAECRRRGVSRSEFIRMAVAETFRRAQDRARAEKYVAGYKAAPESDEEVSQALQQAAAVLSEEPWV
jgi:metal-responsive CopG/Arc/MetJ family transcriptional regulator